MRPRKLAKTENKQAERKQEWSREDKRQNIYVTLIKMLRRLCSYVAMWLCGYVAMKLCGSVAMSLCSYHHCHCHCHCHYHCHCHCHCLFCGFQYCFAFNLWCHMIFREPDLWFSTIHCLNFEAKNAERATILEWQTRSHKHVWLVGRGVWEAGGGDH